LKSRLGILIAGTLAVWAVLYLPVRFLGGQEAAIYSLVAALLCLIPSSLTLAWASHAEGMDGNRQVVLALGGTGMRMGFVLGVGLGLYLSCAYFQQSSFWVWLLVFYLFTLSLEMVLLRRGQSVRE
jgi:hypothetical protein